MGQLYLTLKGVLHELTLSARIVVFGLAALCLAMALPSVKHDAFGWSLLISGAVAGMAGLVVAVLTFMGERKNNPSARFGQAGSPFWLGMDIGLTVALCLYIVLAAISGYVFLGYLLYTAIA